MQIALITKTSNKKLSQYTKHKTSIANCLLQVTSSQPKSQITLVFLLATCYHLLNYNSPDIIHL